jgi:hypothetical protein
LLHYCGIRDQVSHGTIAGAFYLAISYTTTQGGGDFIVAPSADFNQPCTPEVAKSGEFYNGQEHQRDNPGADRKRAITPEQKQRIRELYAAGKTGHEIARMMGLGSTTAYNHLGLGRQGTPAWTDDEIQVLVDGYLENKSPREIAEKVGRSPRAVIIRMCRHRKQVRKDPKKRRALSAITMAFRAVRKADIFRELVE